MNILDVIFLVAGAAICLFCGLFAVTSIREKMMRAAAISGAALLVVGLAWFGGYFLLIPAGYVMTVVLIAIALLAFLYFVPIGSVKPLPTGGLNEKFDERDVIFSREEYTPGTDKYENYYAMRPDNISVDDRIRRLPELFEPGGRYYDAERSAAVDSTFDLIESLTTDVDGEVSPNRRETDPADMTSKIKEMVLQLGGDEVGIATLNAMHVYSHVGRGPEQWGAPVVNDHRFAIAFTLEMSYENVEAAPGMGIVEESARQYLRGAKISISVAEHIRALGYPARAHIAGSNYQVLMVPVAHDAGLGELGRLGYLISPLFGPRIRLGAVTTDLPLVPDSPISFGVQDFCAKCRKCATNCPPGAIPKGEKAPRRGVDKWSLNAEQCLYYWRTIGTDCGLCMKVCPYSHPPTLVHNLVRAGIKRSAFARTVSVWGDDLLYGKQAKHEPS